MSLCSRLFLSLGLLLVGPTLGTAAQPASSQDAAAAKIKKLQGIAERDNAAPGRPVIGVVFKEDYNRRLKASDLDFLTSLTKLSGLRSKATMILARLFFRGSLG